MLVRVAAANALARLPRSPRDAAVTVPPLTATLKDTDAQVRMATAGVLAGLGTARPVAGGSGVRQERQEQDRLPGRVWGGGLRWAQRE